MPTVTRRRALTALSTAGLAVLAGCSGRSQTMAPGTSVPTQDPSGLATPHVARNVALTTDDLTLLGKDDDRNFDPKPIKTLYKKTVVPLHEAADAVMLADQPNPTQVMVLVEDGKDPRNNLVPTCLDRSDTQVVEDPSGEAYLELHEYALGSDPTLVPWGYTYDSSEPATLTRKILVLPQGKQSLYVRSGTERRA